VVEATARCSIREVAAVLSRAGLRWHVKEDSPAVGPAY
jgi:hypothetical protein